MRPTKWQASPLERGGVKSPQGIDTPRVDELPWGEETPGVATEGEGVLGEDGRGRGGDVKPPTTQATKEIGAISSNEDMTHGLRTSVLPRAGPQQQQSGGADGARPKNGMHLRRKYGILAPEELAGGPANTRPRVRGVGHGATRGTADQGRTET